MKYSLLSLSVISAVTLCVQATTLPFLGGVNTAGYDFSVASKSSNHLPHELVHILITGTNSGWLLYWKGD